MPKFLKRFRTKKQVDRDLGDRARDAGNWAEAEEHYLAHLAAHPRSAAIWIQLGHVVREQERFADAASHYGKAAELKPEDADPWQHLAYTAKDIDQTDRAIQAFGHYLSLTGRKDGYDQLVALDVKATSYLRVRPHKAATFFLIDDFLKFLADHVTVSGIQRVQIGLLSGLLSKNLSEFQFVISSNVIHEKEITFWRILPSALAEIIAYVASGRDMTRKRLDQLLRITHESAEAVALGDGDTVFFLGAFWIIERTGLTCARLKTRNVRIGVYVYDLIPLSHPEFCHETLVEFFARAFAEIVQFADFYFTISSYVAKELKSFLQSYDLPEVPVEPLPLAHFLTIEDRDAKPAREFLAKFDEKIDGRPYGLYVSTLEGRKNHLYVLNAWQELLRRGKDMPDLVFLGRKGWRSEGLFSFLEGTKYLNGKVHLLHDIGDGDLAYLYRNCDFTLFTSFVEGWGLPVGESLMFGKPCIASSACSIPEVGGEFTDYIDPLNLRDGIDIIESMACDSDYRARRSAEITNKFKPRSWGDVTEALIQLLEQIPPLPDQPSRTPYRLEPCQIIDFRWKKLDITNLSNLLRYPEQVLLGGDFYNQEPFGAWMRGQEGWVELPTISAPGSQVEVVLDLHPAPWAGGLQYELSTEAESADFDPDFDSARLWDKQDRITLSLLNLVVDKAGKVRFRISVKPPVQHIEDDKREFYIGIRSILYVDGEFRKSYPEFFEHYLEVHRFPLDERHNRTIEA